MVLTNGYFSNYLKPFHCWVVIFFVVKVEVDRPIVKVEVDRQQVEGRGSQPGKVKVEDIDSKSTDKMSKVECVTTN
jgi:hypothetical protein